MAIKLTSSVQPLYWQENIPEKRTYIVLGCPRGGTSMVSGALRLAGIDMGGQIDESNNEDQSFITGDSLSVFADRAAKAGFIDQIEKIIKTRNKQNNIWGWKDPLSSYYIADVIKHITNPYLVFVTRDITAVSMRERAENTFDDMDAYTFRVANRVLGAYKAACDIIEKERLPALMVSYERVLRYPVDFAEKIVEFTQPHSDPAQIKSLIRKISDYVQPDKLNGDITLKNINLARQVDAAQAISLSSYTDLGDCYQALSKTVNSAHYGAALEHSQKLLNEIENNFCNAPNLKCPAPEVADIMAGIYYIKAIANANLQEEQAAFSALCQFFDQALIVFHIHSDHTAITRSVMAAAENLFLQISVNFGTGIAPLVREKIDGLRGASKQN